MTTPLFDGRSFAALLFDMDGTVLSSTEATERVWTRFDGLRAQITQGRMKITNG